MQIENDSIRKKFGSYKIEWKIEHFHLLTCKNNWLISSPTFSLRDPFHTTWKLILKAEPNDADEIFLCASLDRMESDTGPESVRANWKISFLNGNKSEYSFAENEYLFERNMSCTVNVVSMNDVLKELQPFKTDVLNLECQLIVSHENRNAFSIYPEQGIKALSRKLLKLYSSRTMFDMALKLSNKLVLAHKAVLYARSPTLASILDSRPQGWSVAAVLHNSVISFGTMQTFIAYLYSGDLDFVTGKPSISIHECALLFDIPEIVDYYIADELTVQTTTNVGEFEYIWPIKDFESIDCKYLLSPPLTEDISETVWKLRLFPYGYRNQKGSVSIFVEIIGGIIPLDVCFEFGIMNPSQEIFNRKRFQKSEKDDGPLGFPKFSSRENLSSFLDEDGTLRIIFKLRISTGKPVSSLECNSLSIVTPITKEAALESLSDDMASLYMGRTYSDAVIRCYGHVFKVHKFIFASGSDTFSVTVWAKLRNAYGIEILSISPIVLNVMLFYLYSGTIPNTNYDVICEVHKNAKKYHMYGLMNKCLQRYNEGEG